jgi:hypothetical protein
MDADGRDRPEVEVLDTGRPPGALQRWMSGALRRPAARAALAVGVALVLAGVWSTLPGDEPTPAADVEPTVAGDEVPGLRPPPARGREPSTGDWRIAEDLAVRSGPRGHTITFSATNGGVEPQDPRDLEVTAEFVDRPGLTYRGTCAAVRRTPQGYRPLRGTVKPQQPVLVRCRDVTQYDGDTAWIALSSITVRRIPCESEASSLPM